MESQDGSQLAQSKTLFMSPEICPLLCQAD